MSYRIFYQTNEERKLRERLSTVWTGIGIGRFGFIVVGRTGKQRDEGILFDRKILNLQATYNSTWSNLVLFSRFAKRQDRSIRQFLVLANATLHEKLTLDFRGDRTHWRDHRKTWLVRIKGNYQFTRQMGSRLYIERVDEQLEREVNYNFNWVFDYEFTPESHFYLVFVRDQKNRRAMFTKLAYLFDSSSVL